MTNRNDENSARQNNLGTRRVERRTRGLSQRLRKPLSIESNIPPAEEEVKPSGGGDLHTKAVSSPPVAKTKAVVPHEAAVLVYRFKVRSGKKLLSNTRLI